MKIKKLKIKLNKDNEYSDYRYFMPKSNNIKMTDGRDVDEAVQSLKDKIANLKEQANYLINKAPLVKYAEGASIILTDCAEAPLRKLTIEGNSKQETRSGKNLCKLADKIDTSNGITSVITDGVVSVNGTATSTWFNLTTNQSFKLNAGIYTVSVNKALTQFGIDFYDSSGTVFSLAKNLTSAKITLSSEKIITRLVGVVANGEVLNIDGLTFQIEEGSIATEYEQYGASPSIESEAPIESVGDNINEFDIETVTLKKAINAQGQIVDLASFCYSDYIEANPLTTYTLSYIAKTNNQTTRIHFYNKNKEWLSQESIVDKTVDTLCQLSVKTPAECKYIVISIVNTNEDIKLSKGTKATPYSPYGQGSVGIKQANKNFLDMTNAKGGTSGGITCTVNNNGSYSYVGTATSMAVNVWLLGGYSSSDTMPVLFTLKAGTYYVKDCRLYNKTSNVGGTKDGEIITLTKDTNITGVRAVNAVVGTNYNETLYPIIALSNAPVDFIQHQSQTKALYTQQPFRAIGDVKDRFVKQDGVWYEEHKIFRKIFDGTENWLLGAPNYRYYIEINNKAEMSNIDITPLSSRFVCVSGTGIEIDYDTIWLQKLSDSSFRINIFNTNYLSDLANFKKWLTELYNAGTPVYVDYVLETPTLIPCTAEQVEVLESLQSYDKITYYSVDKTNNVQANIKLIYKQDINAILEGEGV